MDKKEFHVLIKYCFLKGKNTVEAKTWLDAEFPEAAPGKSTITDCFLIKSKVPFCQVTSHGPVQVVFRSSNVR
ncbi:hypothetical protein GWI33_018525 [Rhynchophorus ferrugineus]|uniref:Mos1 transposase HTH domain-containing protein n=1 Tax=Rhynchophorus ferrugineus TaxID=354439 RepID=A0A834M7Y3_RHYFE|nr:hypothetical protein GWI33_018525 [Rhynchophorus ferrugineus]